MARPQLSGSRLNAARAQKQQSKVLHIAIDNGTTKTHVCLWIGVPGQPPEDGEIIDFELDGQDADMPSKLAFDDNGHFRWGWEVEKMLAEDGLSHEQVISHLKLLFYPRSLDDSLFARTARERLEDLDCTLLKCPKDSTIEVKKSALLALHLRGILDAVDNFVAIDIRYKLELDRETVRNLPRKVFISVPGMWLPPGNRSVLKAAEWAGLKHNEVELIYEPQAAAAHWARTVKIHGASRYAKGAGIIVLDAGGGTSDLAAYKLQQDSNAGPELQLKATKDALGGLCGSEYVNQRFLLWLDEVTQTEHGCSKKDMASYLGISEAEFDDSANSGFEEVKIKASEVRTKWPREILVKGTENRSFRISLEKAQITELCRPIIEDNVQLVQRFMGDHVRALVVLGGFAKSDQLIKRLKEAFADRDTDVARASKSSVGYLDPVARGGLLKYHQSVKRPLVPNDCFFLAEHQYFAPYKHPDLARVAVGSGTRGGSVRMVADEELIGEDDRYPGDQYAFDRVRTILPATGRQPVRHYWQDRRFKADDKNMELQIYWSKTARQEHSPVTKVNGAFELQDGIECWGPPLFADLPDLKSLGFVLHETSPGHPPEYKVAIRVILRWTPQRIWARLEMASAEYTDKALDHATRYETEVLLPEDDLADEHVIVLLKEDELAQEDFNPTPRE